MLLNLNLKLKKIIAPTLVIILFLPITVKLADSLFHHHEYVDFKIKNETTYINHHEICSILSYEFSFYTFDKTQFQAKNHSLKDLYLNLYSLKIFYSGIKYSFLLRAPPALLI